MKTYLECIPCFFSQGIESAKILGADKKIQKQIIDEISAVIPSFSLASSPPEMGKIVHDIIKTSLRNDDPYKELKKKSNQLALGVYGKLKKKVENSSDTLLAGLELSIAGNIIDYGANHNVQVEEEVVKIMNRESALLRRNHFQYGRFKKKLAASDRILFIGDNAGEILFDRILIEEIKKLYPLKEVTYAVREEPVINDITIEDALFVGMDRVAKVVSSGSTIPGTLLSSCNKKFVKLFDRADMIISKGQGNFETLPEDNGRLFFMLTVKCQVVGQRLDAEKGDIILKNGGKIRREK